ncbi:MAG: DUF5104 domain-containing protein [Oscillospiraceae bacterium]
MAFASMVIAFLFIVLCVLGGLFIIGSILLIIGLVHYRKDLKIGIKPRIALIVTGCIFLLPPVGLTAALVTSVGVNAIKTNIQRLSYENEIDKWRNEYVSDSEAANGVYKAMIKAADDGDKAAMKALFSESIQNDAVLDGQIADFLNVYPGGFSDIEAEYDPGGSHGGGGEDHFSAGFEAEKDGVRYFIRLSGCTKNDNAPENIGLEKFCFYSDRAYVEHDDIKDYSDPYESHYIRAAVDAAGDFEVRYIDGYPQKFYSYDRVITREEFLNAYRSCRSVSELEEKLGTANVNDAGLEKVFFELEEKDGEPQYGSVYYDYYGRIEGDAEISCGSESEYFEK